MEFISTSYLFRVIIPALIAVAIGISVEQFLESRIESYGKEEGALASHIHITRLFVRWISVLVIIFIVAGIFGIALGSLWLSISAVVSMIVIGFVAGWSLIGNILAGIIVMIWRPFKMDDHITILPDDVSGKVADLNLFYGVLETEGGDRINVPNVSFLQKYIKVSSGKTESQAGLE